MELGQKQEPNQLQQSADKSRHFQGSYGAEQVDQVEDEEEEDDDGDEEEDEEAKQAAATAAAAVSVDSKEVSSGAQVTLGSGGGGGISGQFKQAARQQHLKLAAATSSQRHLGGAGNRSASVASAVSSLLSIWSHSPQSSRSMSRSRSRSGSRSSRNSNSSSTEDEAEENRCRKRRRPAVMHFAGHGAGSLETPPDRLNAAEEEDDDDDGEASVTSCFESQSFDLNASCSILNQNSDSNKSDKFNSKDADPALRVTEICRDAHSATAAAHDGASSPAAAAAAIEAPTSAATASGTQRAAHFPRKSPSDTLRRTGCYLSADNDAPDLVAYAENIANPATDTPASSSSSDSSALAAPAAAASADLQNPNPNPNTNTNTNCSSAKSNLAANACNFISPTRGNNGAPVQTSTKQPQASAPAPAACGQLAEVDRCPQQHLSSTGKSVASPALTSASPLSSIKACHLNPAAQHQQRHKVSQAPNCKPSKQSEQLNHNRMQQVTQQQHFVSQTSQASANNNGSQQHFATQAAAAAAHFSASSTASSTAASLVESAVAMAFASSSPSGQHQHQHLQQQQQQQHQHQHQATSPTSPASNSSVSSDASSSSPTDTKQQQQLTTATANVIAIKADNNNEIHDKAPVQQVHQQQQQHQQQMPRFYPPNHPLGKSKHLCSICGDRATGKHYGVFSCEGCKGFFKRTIRKDIVYVCRANGDCLIDIRQRNKCQYCRYQRCLRRGMRREAVQEEKQRLKLRAASNNSANSNSAGNIASSLPSFNQMSNQNCDNLVEASSTSNQMIASQVYQQQHHSPMPPQTMAQSPMYHHHHHHHQQQNGNYQNYQQQNYNNHNDNHFKYHQQVMKDHNSFYNQTIAANAAAAAAFAYDQSINESLSNGGQHISAAASNYFNNSTGNGSPATMFGHNNSRKIQQNNRLDDQTLKWAAHMQIENLLDWAKAVPRFTELLIDDQVTLLKSCWNELIIADISFKSMDRFKENQQTLSIAKNLFVNEQQAYEVGLGNMFDRIIGELVVRMCEMKIDMDELSCLRAIILFNPETQGLKSSQPIEEFRGNVYTALEQHCRKNYNNQPNRFGKLLLRLPALRTIGLKCDSTRICDNNSTNSIIVNSINSNFNSNHSPNNKTTMCHHHPSNLYQPHHHSHQHHNHHNEPMCRTPNSLSNASTTSSASASSSNNNNNPSSASSTCSTSSSTNNNNNTQPLTANGSNINGSNSPANQTSNGLSNKGGSTTNLLGHQVKLLFFDICYESSSIDSFLRSSLSKYKSTDHIH